jgi:hypothetical protein
MNKSELIKTVAAAALDQAVDAILDRLDAQDLPGARSHFDAATQGKREAVEVLVKQLAATVATPLGVVVWGHGIDVWANPHRFDYAWRCGGCRWTGSNYVTDHAARSGGRLAVVWYCDDAYWDAVDAAAGS